MSAYTDRLRAVADHFDRYPHLEVNSARVDVTSGLRVQVHGSRDGVTHLSALAAWVPTLTSCHPIDMDYHSDGETVTLALNARLVDGTRVNLVCLPDAVELDLLAANTRMDDTATIPVDLLVRLVDHERAEQLPALARSTDLRCARHEQHRSHYWTPDVHADGDRRWFRCDGDADAFAGLPNVGEHDHAMCEDAVVDAAAGAVAR
jgi:hypothetical protein